MDLSPEQIAAIRSVLWSAFAATDDPMAESDWEHALGGLHFVVEDGGVIGAYASVAERPIRIGGRLLRTGYLEAVAVAPDRHGRGIGSVLMGEVDGYIRDNFELGALGTGVHHFYERLGWFTWRGESFVREPGGGLRATPDEDGYIMVLQTPSTPALDPKASIECDSRDGEAW